MTEFAQFCRRALKPGAYVFIFTSIQYFNDWATSFQKAGFTCSLYPFVILKNAEEMQAFRGRKLPQNSAEYGLVGYAPGNNSDSFTFDSSSPYHFIKTGEKRKFAAISGVPVPKCKLMKTGTRSPVLTEEKNVDLLSELMTTFCPENGLVGDMYGGTLTTAIAAIATMRKCVVVEADCARYRIAYERLKGIAIDVFTRKRMSNGIENMMTVQSSQPQKSDNTCAAAQKGKEAANVIVPTEADGGTKSVTTEPGKRITEPEMSSKERAGCRIGTYNGLGMEPGSSRNDAGITEKEMGNEAINRTSVDIAIKEALSGEEGHTGGRNEGSKKEKEKEGCDNDIRGGDEVFLLVGNERVAKARVQYPVDKENEQYRYTLHGEDLRKYKGEGMRLVAVFSVEPMKPNTDYPYTYGGIEPPPAKVGEMGNGFCAWDVKEMEKIVPKT